MKKKKKIMNNYLYCSTATCTVLPLLPGNTVSQLVVKHTLPSLDHYRSWVMPVAAGKVALAVAVVFLQPLSGELLYTIESAHHARQVIHSYVNIGSNPHLEITLIHVAQREKFPRKVAVLFKDSSNVFLRWR